jgi:hypothetical protein
LEFQILESDFRFVDFLTAEFKEKNPARISGNENGIRILLPMGVPEIETKNWNSQPSFVMTNMSLMYAHTYSSTAISLPISTLKMSADPENPIGNHK